MGNSCQNANSSAAGISNPEATATPAIAIVHRTEGSLPLNGHLAKQKIRPRIGSLGLVGAAGFFLKTRVQPFAQSEKILKQDAGITQGSKDELHPPLPDPVTPAPWLWNSHR